MRKIRLTESQLHRVIMESVEHILNEIKVENAPGDYFDTLEATLNGTIKSEGHNVEDNIDDAEYNPNDDYIPYFEGWLPGE